MSQGRVFYYEINMRRKAHLGVVWEESVTNLVGVRVQANTHYSEQVRDNEGEPSHPFFQSRDCERRLRL